MRDKITKKYSNGEITVVWEPSKCSHSGLCWKGLNAVFDPRNRPWVKMDGATSEEIESQVSKCPSGALSSFRASNSELFSEPNSATVVEVTPAGPLVVRGDFSILHTDGNEERHQHRVSLCRCGQSGNKPFCDGSHTRVGFKG